LILAQGERWRRALGMQVERFQYYRFTNSSERVLKCFWNSGRRVSNAQEVAFRFGIAHRKVG